MVSNLYTEVSEFEFSVDMTTDVLCDWLKINKLKDKYIAILSGEVHVVVSLSNECD